MKWSWHERTTFEKSYTAVSILMSIALFPLSLLALLVGGAAYLIACSVKRRKNKKMKDHENNVQEDCSENLVEAQVDAENYCDHKAAVQGSVEEKDAYPKAKLSGFFADFGRVLSLRWSWHERTTLEKSYTVVSILMIIALLPMPYDFYQSMRIFVFIGLYLYGQVIFPLRANEPKWFYVLLALFALYNPIIPIHFGEQIIWTILNIATLWTLYRARLRFDVNLKA